MTKKRKLPPSEESEHRPNKKRNVKQKPADVASSKLSQKQNVGRKPGKSKHSKVKKNKLHERKQDKQVQKYAQETSKTGGHEKSVKPRNEEPVSKMDSMTAGKGVIVPLPKSAEDISANWKLLQKTLKHSHHPRRHKTDGNKSHRHQEKEAETKHVFREPEPDIWFDDVDEVLLESSKNKPQQNESGAKWDNSKNPLVKDHSFSGLTKVVAMDCEMVGVGEGGMDSVLARVSLVNSHGVCVYDKLVRPRERVIDYRTKYSGIRPGDLEKGEDFKVVQKEVDDILKNRVLVGHAIGNDLQVLFLDHPRKMIRDTSRYRPFRALFQGKTPSLKKLSDKVLGVQVQEGEHNSIQDAQAAMRLYTMYRKTWEKELKTGGKKKLKNKTKQSKDTAKQNTTSMLDSDEEDVT